VGKQNILTAYCISNISAKKTIKIGYSEPKCETFGTECTTDIDTDVLLMLTESWADVQHIAVPVSWTKLSLP